MVTETSTNTAFNIDSLSKNIDSAETDSLLIEKEFAELPPEKVTLLAVNLAREDGFAKTLITGSLTTSAELQNRISHNFVRTHRGYYMSSARSHLSIPNEYLSFRLGSAERLYSESRTNLDHEWEDGLGFACVGQKLVDQSTSKVSWGDLSLRRIVKQMRQHNLELPKQLAHMSEEELRIYDYKPPKEDIISLIHLARKYKTITQNHQAELNVFSEKGKLPRLPLSETIIFIPSRKKAECTELLRVKLAEIKPYAQKIKRTFGVDITSLTPEKILANYTNIYWYPQKNIDLAVKYLSTHPEKITQLLPKTQPPKPWWRKIRKLFGLI